VIAPPHQWSASKTDALSLLEGVQTMVDQQYLSPAGLATLASGPTPTAKVAPGYSAQGAELSVVAAQNVAEATTHAWDLYDSMEQDPTSTVTPSQVMSPTFNALLRAASGAWRGNDAGAAAALSVPSTLLGGIEGNVGVVQPGSPITLASEDSPLPVRMFNNLPVSGEGQREAPVAERITAPPSLQWISAGLPRDVLITPPCPAAAGSP